MFGEKEDQVKAFENKILKQIFGSFKMDQNGEWRKV